MQCPKRLFYNSLIKMSIWDSSENLNERYWALRGGDLLNYDNFVLYDSLTNKPVAKLSQNMQNTLAEWKEKRI